MLHRLLSSSANERLKPKEEVKEPCEVIEDGQPHNPYTEILLLQHHSDIIRILLRINDKRFVSAGDDNKAVIWEVQYGKRIATLVGHSHPITCLLAMTATDHQKNETLIISGSSDKQIRIWDSETGSCRQVLTAHGASVRSIQAVGDDLFCAGGENLSLWNVSGDLLHTVHNSAAEDVDLMITIIHNRVIAAADKELWAYKVENNAEEDKMELLKLKQLQSHRETIRSLVSVSTSCFATGSVDGSILLWACSNLQQVRCLNAASDIEETDPRFPYSDSIQSMMCVQERYLFAAVGCGFYVFDVNAEREENIVIQKKAAHFSKVTCMGFASEGNFLVTCSEDKSLRLWGRKPSSDHWNVRDDFAMTTMEKFTGMHSQELHQLCSQILWEPTLLGECSAHGGSVQGFLDFDHEGIVTCGADGLVIVWKNTEMQKVRRNQTMRKLLLSCDGIV